MSSSPFKNYKNSDIIKDHLCKLKELKNSGLIKIHELAQMIKLEHELVEIERSEGNKTPSNYPKG